jgi:hypothetical protein
MCFSSHSCVLHVSLITLHLVNIIFGEGSYYIAFSNLITSSLLGSDIILGTFSQTLRVCSSFNVTDSISLAENNRENYVFFYYLFIYFILFFLIHFTFKQLKGKLKTLCRIHASVQFHLLMEKIGFLWLKPFTHVPPKPAVNEILFLPTIYTDTEDYIVSHCSVCFL